MKKLILIACLAVVAAVVAPVASASAGELIGTCTITGTATIEPEGLPSPSASLEPPEVKLTKKLTYKFKSEAIALVGNQTTCSGTGKEAGIDVAVAGGASASVEGKGQLSCPASVGGGGVVLESGAPGVGTIKAKGKVLPLLTTEEEVTASFTGFIFVGTGTNVTFAIQDAGGSAAAGEATFAQDVAAVGACATSAEPTKLQFTAVATGKIG
jgi:hypothetical protein